MENPSIWLQYIVAIGIFGVLDAIWLGLIAKKLYKEQIGHLMSKKPVWPAAVIFYLLYLAGVVYFVISPSMDESVSWALVNGGLLGALCYATYDFTNWATLKNWPPKIVVIDLIWGSSATALLAAGVRVILG